MPRALITRLESRVGLGIPDCLVALDKPESKFVMIELKVVKRGKQINLSPHQVAFHLKHSFDMLCPTFILVQYHPPGTTSSKTAELRLYRGDKAGTLCMLGIDTPPDWSCNLATMQWHMLRQELMMG